MSTLVYTWLLVAPFADGTPIEPPNYRFPVSVTRIVDGDTFRADVRLPFDVVLANQSIRMLGVDAWETRGPERARGLRAKRFAARLLDNREVWIVPGDRERDSFGRILADVYVRRSDGAWVDVDRLLICFGHGEER